MHGPPSIVVDLALVYGVAVVIAVAFMRVGLPPVLAYIGTGFVLGPPALAWVERSDALDILAEVGVVMLLFTLGLEFSLATLRREWRSVLLAGGAQVVLTVGVAAVAANRLGAPWPMAVVWGFLLSLSSTAIVLRLLDARGETKAAHGRLVVGVLIFQDLCVVPMLLLIPMLAGGGTGVGGVASTLLLAMLTVAAVVACARVAVPPLLVAVARSGNREVFLLTVLAVAGLTAWGTSLAGLSLALGAFLAGMVLADSHFAHQAMSDVLPLRGAMMCLFFVTVGMLIDPAVLVERPAAVGGLFVAIVAGKLLLLVAVALVARLPLRIGILAGSFLAQVGEFSFVLAGTAADHGLITQDARRGFLAASLLSIVVSPVLVTLSPRLLAGTRVLARLDRLLGGRALHGEPLPPLRDHVVIAGFGVGGRVVEEALRRCGVPVVVIELNPDTVRVERRRGHSMIYGDSTSAEILEQAGLRHARSLVVAVSDDNAVRTTTRTARGLRPDLPVFARTRWASDEGMLRTEGAAVISEEFTGAMALAREVLDRCDLCNTRVLDEIAIAHGQLPPGDEGPLPS